LAHAIHDFTAKLRQPSLAPHVDAYVRWRRAVRSARERGEPVPSAPDLAPISINLDLTTACNYACTHCIDWDILNTRHKYKEAELRDSLTLMAERGLRSVILIGGGEPTLYPRFASFVSFLKELGLQVSIVSNGSRCDRLAEAVVHMDERDWIRLSLDSGSNELFVKMHKPADKKLDLDSICEGVGEIKRANPRVLVGFSYIIVWSGASRDDHEILENIHEIVQATERAKRYGFDYISLKPILERETNGAEVMDPEKTRSETATVVQRIRHEVDRAQELADESFRVYESNNLRVLEQGNWHEFTHQPRTCHMQALRQVLTPTGLYNCPAHRGVEKARLGSPTAYRDGQEAAATNASLTQILDGFDASHECRNVTCIYNSVNWWLEKLIEDPREDVRVEIGEERADFFL
jgi:wyosine [tRNA(Phe)-imidazoG37] synthetase (radical SAM superfamily)